MEVLERGWFILGPALEEFERKFAEYCGVGHAVGVASGTEALQLALLSGGAKPGDEVITVANTAVPTVAAIRMAGCVPVFADIDPATYTLDPASLEAAITPRTVAVIPVHLYGNCAAMAPILEVAARHGLRVVEDCAQAHGAALEGRKAGTFGDFGCFSFYPTKNLGALGDAGAVVTRSPEAAERLRLLRNYGQTRRYYHAQEGYNSRLDEVQAAVLSVKLKHLESNNDARRSLARTYRDGLEGTPLVLPAEAPRGRHVYHLFVVRTRSREAFGAYLARHGVETLIHYPLPVYWQEAYRAFAPARPLPVTEEVVAGVVSLPLYPHLGEDKVLRVCDVIRRGFSEGAY